MMNLIALAFLASYFGAVVVLVPEPQLIRADHHVVVPEPQLIRTNDHHAYESPSPFGGLFRSGKQSAQNTVCDEEPCPSFVDQAKDTVHQGYDNTVEGMQIAKESAKDTVGGVYQQAKHGVQNTAEQAKDKAGQVKQGVEDKAGNVKQGTYDTAQHAKQGVQDKAGQVKHGVQEAVGKVTSHIPSAEDVKEGFSETGEKITSYIPGIDTGKEATDAVKQKVGETKDRVASFVDPSSSDSLRRKLEEAKQQVASYMRGKENDASYLAFVDMKKTLDEASSYIPSKETAASYIPGKDSIGGIKKSVEETTQGVKDKAQDASEGVKDTAQDASESARNAAQGTGERAASGGYTGKLGGVLHGMKERLTGGGEKRRGGSAQLEKKVYELCSWFDDGAQAQTIKGGGHTVGLDVAATRESYAYLMENALGSIDNAREVFERAAVDNAGGEWREKYAYLAESAKGALEAAKEVFERAASAAVGSATPHTSSEMVGKTRGMSRFKEAAVHTKHRLSATVRPLMRTVYLATFSALYGTTLWMTFLSGHLLSRSLLRQQLGYVQSKLFPVYLNLVSGCLVLCGIVHAVLHPWPSADRSEHWQYANFAVCIGLSLVNMLVVEPRATKVMFEKLKFEKEEGRGQSGEVVTDEAVKGRATSIDAKLKGLHQMASCLNLAIVAGLTGHLWYLSNRLVV